ncbi:MAG: PP2C family protein-serine/threonine phosphatase [Opitutales bacterium]
MKFSSYGETHPGCVRERNEDAVLAVPDRALFAVADGLGGLPDGNEASRLAIEHLERLICAGPAEAEVDLAAVFSEINGIVHAVGLERHGEGGIGTTLTAAMVRNERLHIAHVGDSVAFLWRGGTLHILTEEHTVAALYGGSHTHRGETSLPEYYFHTLTRCIGATPEVETELEDYELRPGDCLLLCTDGLTKVLPTDEIAEVLGRTVTASQSVEILLEMALERGGPDNLGLVAVVFESED